MAQIQLSENQREAVTAVRHLAVRANAGSGKTSVLTLRYIWLVVNEGVPFDKVVAITFTTKAAAEMVERIHQYVSVLISSEEERRNLGFTASKTAVMGRLFELRESLAEARIATFHAFCSRILRQFGHEIGVDPDAREVTPTERHQFIQSAIRETIREQLRTNAEAFLTAMNVLDIHDVERFLFSLTGDTNSLEQLQKAGMALDADTYAQQTESKFCAVLRRVVDTELATIERDVIRVGGSSIPDAQPVLDLIHGARTLCATNGDMAELLTQSINVRELLYTASGTGRKSKAPFAETQYLEPLSKVWKNIIAPAQEMYQRGETNNIGAEVAQLIYQLAVRSTLRYTQIKREHSAIDYDDMITETINMFESSSSLLSLVRSGIQHLLVDEFQDTNEQQYRLLAHLVPALENSTKASAKIFVVGDDKQSIYGFRGADVRVFAKTAKNIQRANLELGHPERSIITLSTSYRMTDALATVVNNICSASFEGTSEFDVEYSPLETVRTSAIEHPLTFITTNTKLSDNDEQSGQDIENAHVVMRVIERLNNQQHPVEPRDIAILCKRTQTVADIGKLLYHHNVPYQTHGGRAFFSQPEVADIRNLVLVLMNPSNALAMAALLRSPIFSFTDNQLIELAAADQGVTFQSIVSLVERGVSWTELTVAHRVLSEAFERINRERPSSIITSVLQHSGWYNTLGSERRREQIISNVNKVIDICRSVEETPGTHLADIEEALRVPDVTDVESEANYQANENVVNVLTIHAAKGLEFPVVFLADISSGKQWQSYASTDVLGFTAGKTLLNETNKLVSDQRSEAEEKRLLYVALTRAKNEVYVSIRYSVTKSGERSKATSLAALLDDIAFSDIYPELPFVGEDSSIPFYEPIGLPSSNTSAAIDVSSMIPEFHLHRVNATSLQKDVDEHSDGYDIGSEFSLDDAITIGSVTHDVLEHVLSKVSTTNKPMELASALSDPVTQSIFKRYDVATSSAIHSRVVECIRQAVDITNSEIGALPLRDGTFRTEADIGAPLESTILFGRVDVLIQTPTTSIVWDWKTNSAHSPDAINQLSRQYALQMKAYAYVLLCDNNTETVETTLWFLGGTAPQSHTERFTKSGIEQLRTEILAAMNSSISQPLAEQHR